MASPDKKAFALRIDPALWKQIEQLASAELRSVNAQVEYLLREALRQRRSGARATPAATEPTHTPGAAPDSHSSSN